MAVITYKCPNCGGPLTWDAEKQKYFCDYCNSAFTQQDIAKMQPESAAAQADGDSGASARSETNGAQTGADDGAQSGSKAVSQGKKPQAMHYSCPNCGAEIMTDETTAASTCYYCHNPVVLTDRLEGDKLPDCIVPFEISREKAREIFLQWVKRHRYIPSDFYNEKQIDTMTGVYFPYWIYSCKAEGDLDAEGKRLRIWTAGNLQFTETQVYDLSRSGVMEVGNVTRIALKKASRVLCEGVMPFQPEKMQPFSTAYLQGYSAEMRDIERDGMDDEVQKEIREFAAERLQQSAGEGFNSVDVKNVRVDLKDGTWKYAMLPVWTLTYKDPSSDKIYYFSINGQTGKTCGELPTSGKKLFRLFLTVFIPTMIVMLLILYYLF